MGPGIAQIHPSQCRRIRAKPLRCPALCFVMVEDRVLTLQRNTTAYKLRHQLATRLLQAARRWVMALSLRTIVSHGCSRSSGRTPITISIHNSLLASITRRQNFRLPLAFTPVLISRLLPPLQLSVGCHIAAGVLNSAEGRVPAGVQPCAARAPPKPSVSLLAAGPHKWR